MRDEYSGTLTPVWIVYVDGRRLDTEHEGALKRIFINDALNSQGECRLLFMQDLSPRGVLTLFSTVEVCLGYKDDVSCVFCGDITARRFGLDKDGCRFEIRCANAFHKMQHGMQNIVYEHKTPSDIVRGVIEKHGLHAETEEFGPVYEFKVQHCCTDFEFVRDLARSYGKEVYAWNNTVYVQDEMRLSTEELIYEKGKSLISCRAEQSLIYEKEAVFIDTDIQNGERIEGRSVHPEGGKHRQYIKEYCIDNEDAQNRAYGYMKNVLKEYRIADIQVTGDPRLKPGMRVELKYVDSDTDGEYIAERVKHELNAVGYVSYAYLYKPITPTGKPRDRVHKEKKEEKKQPEEQEEKAATEDLSKSIRNLAWKKDGTVIGKALVGDEVTLCADTKNIADGTSATIKITDLQPNGDTIDVETIKGKVEARRLQVKWRIKYKKGEDFENREYKMHEYKFTVSLDGIESTISKELKVCVHNDTDILMIVNYIISEMRKNIKSKICLLIKMNIQTFKTVNKLPFLTTTMTTGTLSFGALSAALALWTKQVRVGGPWDHKPKIVQKFEHKGVERPLKKTNNYSNSHYHKYKEYDYFYDIWSNIHFGYIGTYCGLPEWLLLDGAGIEQLITNTLTGEKTEATGPSKLPRKYDNPEDRESITLGIRLYQRYPNPQDINAYIILSELEKIDADSMRDSKLPHICREK